MGGLIRAATGSSTVTDPPDRNERSALQGSTRVARLRRGAYNRGTGQGEMWSRRLKAHWVQCGRVPAMYTVEREGEDKDT